MKFLQVVLILSLLPGVWSFAVPRHVPTLCTSPAGRPVTHYHMSKTVTEHTWSPQDLTKDTKGFKPIPEDDYVKNYQKHPELWPVEFFLMVYRRIGGKTQLLVRESANGTSKWGVGTGVPVTRWLLSTVNPPTGYQWSNSANEGRIGFDARNFPEFPKGETSWAYNKIDIREDAFNGAGTAKEFQDPELEEYAQKIREGLRKLISKLKESQDLSEWESSRLSIAQNILDNNNSVAAIQGTLRMSGIFAHKELTDGPRYQSLGQNAPDLKKLVESVRIYTMFPQMPDPMPLPSTSPEELKEEIATRDSRMAKSGRDPHQDVHGRTYTHRSTSNVSNTIHGVYLALDATNLFPEDQDVPPALNLFGTKQVQRQWKSLQDLKVLDVDGKSISTEDPKPTFISGFIVRQLVKENVIDTSIHE